MNLQGILEKRGSEVLLAGEARVPLFDFRVECPSTLVAKPHPAVVIGYQGSISATQKD